jgi:amino-acid N-acetyltransferase
MRNTCIMSAPATSFTEKDFYLAEFRGRSIGIVLPSVMPDDLAPIEGVLRDLAENHTPVVLFGATTESLARLAPDPVVFDEHTAWSGTLWRRIAAERAVGVSLAGHDFPRSCREAIVRLRLAKVVWVDERGPLRNGGGARMSVVALSDLSRLIDEAAARSDGEPIPLAEIRVMLEGGVTSVSVCRLDALAEELFTYAGSGTLFTRERYADVRRLSLDDFDSAAFLLARGVAEGYLAPRPDAEIEEILSHGFGVFIEGRYLAGIGALRPYAETRSGEIAGLYTLTRFAGEGVGGHLIRFAIECAREAGMEQVFACTTSDRVEGFFLRNGFERAAADDLPPAKWIGYPAERRARILCVRRKVD